MPRSLFTLHHLKAFAVMYVDWFVRWPMSALKGKKTNDWKLEKVRTETPRQDKQKMKTRHERISFLCRRVYRVLHFCHGVCPAIDLSCPDKKKVERTTSDDLKKACFRQKNMQSKTRYYNNVTDCRVFDVPLFLHQTHAHLTWQKAAFIVKGFILDIYLKMNY